MSTIPLKYLLLVLALMVSASVLVYYLFGPDKSPQQAQPEPMSVASAVPDPQPSGEQAETSALEFVKNAQAVLSSETNTDSLNAMYNALSSNARQSIDLDTLSRETVKIVGPEGSEVNVIDLIVENGITSVIVEFNYPEGATYRKINMVVEDKEWKIGSIEYIDQESLTPEL